MHTSYMYTRDHPQSRLDDMDLTLDSVDLQNLRDLGPIRADNSLLEGTGFTIDDFYVGQMVEAGSIVPGGWVKSSTSRRKEI